MIIKQNDLLWTLIHDVAHRLRLEIDRRVKAHNLTRIKWLALQAIAESPVLTQSELAAHLEIGAAATGRLIDRLEKRGFVNRMPAPDDRRAYHLHLTKMAENLVAELDDMAVTLREEVFAGLSERQVSTLNSGLNHLKANLRRACKTFAVPVVLLPIHPEVACELEFAASVVCVF